jgi:hypothetical protein
MEQGLLGFATLLIGLTVGRMPVELMVSHPVAQVRMVLDGRPIAAIDAPPWRTQIDFGAAPAPHRLEAFGLDGSGARIAHAEQWVNLPRPEAELDLVLERDAAGRPVAARLAWATARLAAPAAVRAELDGEPLPVAGVNRVALPQTAGEGSHFLRVQADFPNGRSAARELAFGGVFSEASTSALTAVPVDVLKGHDPPTVGQVAALLADGRPLRTAAVEKGSARVVAVLDARAVEPLRRAAGVGGTRQKTRMAAGSTWGEISTSCGWLGDALRSGEDEVFLVDPRPAEVVRDDAVSWVFSVRGRAQTRAADLVRVLMRSDLSLLAIERQALTNAVGSAALVAAAGGHRRAVVLVLGGAEDTDSGDLGAVHVRSLLTHLDVPLRVWSPVATLAANDTTGWGPIEDVSTCKLLGRASEALARSVERQRVVWVEGQHLPQDVVVSSPRLVRAR